jgi:hypothetical protein
VIEDAKLLAELDEGGELPVGLVINDKLLALLNIIIPLKEANDVPLLTRTREVLVMLDDVTGLDEGTREPEIVVARAVPEDPEPVRLTLDV